MKNYSAKSSALRALKAIGPKALEAADSILVQNEDLTWGIDMELARNIEAGIVKFVDEETPEVPMAAAPEDESAPEPDMIAPVEEVLAVSDALLNEEESESIEKEPVEDIKETWKQKVIAVADETPNLPQPKRMSAPAGEGIVATCWRIAGANAGKPRKEVVQLIVSAGIKESTARAQYQRWFKFQKQA